MFKSKEFKKYKKTLEKHGLFDAKYYLRHNHDARIASDLPIEHFIKYGLPEDRKPNAEFDPVWYREYYTDVKEDGRYPFVHYCIYGRREGRYQSEEDKNLSMSKVSTIESVFQIESYLAANPDIADAVNNKVFTSAFEHFMEYGLKEVLQGERRLGLEFPFFTEEDYKNTNVDIKQVCENDENFSIAEHLCEHGYTEFLNRERSFGGFYPFELNDEIKEKINNIFDEDAYLARNGDIAKAISDDLFENGWEHFLEHGIWEVRDGKRQIYPKVPLLSELEYVQKNDDIFNALREELITSPYEHFLLHGMTEYADGSRKLSSANQVEYVFKEAAIDENVKNELENFQKKPLISVVMPVYNVEPKWLGLAVESLKKQWYTNWELCLADDKSTNEETVAYLKSLNDPKIKTVFLETNVNISGASNAALSLAVGEYVALMDNDDELTPDAFYEVVKAINEEDAEFIYSDEDKLEMDGTFSDPHFKPDFAPDMFLSQNYISHLGVIKKELLDKVGGWELGLEGAQDYDLYLKVLELTDKIVHIPKVLYHWRKIPGSTAAEFSEKSYAQDAGVRALENALKRRSLSAKVQNGKYPGTYRVQYDIKDEPLVSIIIPFKDKPELLDMSINSVLDKSTYKNYEIIGVSNNSEEKETFEMMSLLEQKDSRVKFIEYNERFNYSAINNYAVNNFAKGEHIVLMNNDIEIITPEWIEELLQFSQRNDVGVVGAKLYYPDDTIQHAGVITGIGGIAGHSHKYFKKEAVGYFGRLHLIQNLSANTAALFMVKKFIFDELKGLNEEKLSIAFNDVDFCLRVQEKKYLNVFTPYCEAYHHESISRGAEDNPEKVKRFNSEVEYMKERHEKILNEGDPFYNVNLTLDYENFEIKQRIK
jgi:glycosyltransferase involved in cell wall biosynthesis